MSTLLRQLYNGEIFPEERYRPCLEEYKALQKRNMEHYNDFIQKLDSPLDKEFIKIMDEQLDVLPLDFFQMFSDGFKLGARMILEIYGSGNEKKTND